MNEVKACSTPVRGEVGVATWKIDPAQSIVSIEVKAIFGLFTVKGTTAVRDGWLQIGEEPLGLQAQLVIDAGSYASGNARRDRDVKAPKLLDAEAYPDITFSSTSVEYRPDGWHVLGVLQARGGAAEIDVHVADLEIVDGGNLRYRAEATIDRTALGMVEKKGMVGRAVVVRVAGIAMLA